MDRVPHYVTPLTLTTYKQQSSEVDQRPKH